MIGMKKDITMDILMEIQMDMTKVLKMQRKQFLRQLRSINFQRGVKKMIEPSTYEEIIEEFIKVNEHNLDKLKEAVKQRVDYDNYMDDYARDY